MLESMCLSTHRHQILIAISVSSQWLADLMRGAQYGAHLLLAQSRQISIGGVKKLSKWFFNWGLGIATHQFDNATQ